LTLIIGYIQRWFNRPQTATHLSLIEINALTATLNNHHQIYHHEPIAKKYH